MDEDLMAEICDIFKGKKLIIFGLQKCGSGTMSHLALQRDNIDWRGHGVFIDRLNINLRKLNIEDNMFDGSRVSTLIFNPAHTQKYSVPEDAKKCPDTVTVVLIRNPFDLYVSTYYHAKAGSNNVSFHPPYDGEDPRSEKGFKSFIMSLRDTEDLYMPLMCISPFYPYYDDQGEFVPDIAIKLEALDEIMERTGGFKRPHSLDSHMSQRPDEKSSAELYDDEMISVVREVFKEDLKCFGYDLGFCDDRPFLRREDIIKAGSSRFKKAHACFKREKK